VPGSPAAKQTTRRRQSLSQTPLKRTTQNTLLLSTPSRTTDMHDNDDDKDTSPLPDELRQTTHASAMEVCSFADIFFKKIENLK